MLPTYAATAGVDAVPANQVFTIESVRLAAVSGIAAVAAALAFAEAALREEEVEEDLFAPVRRKPRTLGQA